MDHLHECLDALEHQVQPLPHQTRTVTRQLRWWRATALLSALLGVMALPSVWADGNPSASGHANLTIAGGLQTYSFTAVQHQNGSVSGQLTLDSRAQDGVHTRFVHKLSLTYYTHN
jgi:hypothetical protein